VSCSGSCEPAEHETDHGEIDESGGHGDEALEVFGEASAAADPCESALDDPALGKDPEGLPVGASDDFEPPRPQRGDGLGGGFAGIGPVGHDTDQTRTFPGERFEQLRRAVAILEIGRMDDPMDDQALRVDEDVALLALDLLCRVIARRIDVCPPFSALLTLCASMMPRLELTARPARVRVSATSTS